ncbi:hypothetical protein [Nocardia sp. NPDC004722]
MCKSSPADCWKSLFVSNDDDDEYWQLIGPTDAGAEGRIGHLSHAVDEDPTLMDILDLEPGFEGTRAAPGSAWTRTAADS